MLLEKNVLEEHGTQLEDQMPIVREKNSVRATKEDLQARIESLPKPHNSVHQIGARIRVTSEQFKLLYGDKLKEADRADDFLTFMIESERRGGVVDY